MAGGWQDIRDEVLRRIQTRRWPPGSQIPNEAELAGEFGVARATVNRALQALAEDGWLERRRRAGTRVAAAPQRRARLAIPLIRQEIEAGGHAAAHRLLGTAPGPAPAAVTAALGLAADAEMIQVRTLWRADERPFAVEDRWVNLSGAPGFDSAPLDRISANEWLVRHAPFSHGTLEYAAETAEPELADLLGCAPGAPVLVLERHTFGPSAPVTFMRLSHAPGHSLKLEI
ncbi:GntR family transcriptional regulator [Pukyongiella litopenaei]|uniref:UTRA domain-containing protein n=1 Tax=Pukyongiella litopenaei TaxID=2605946 RepID=A0A2S0MLJ0_9RHOB|nr:GntR family transcriptional regulator [Pukyongiella litopenaei]AVO36744.1 UTRA domain-containing protein [Pukyongiella litopenaei]